MRLKKLLSIFYVCMQISGITFVLITSQNLPTLVASHFDASGQPNATMPLTHYVAIYLAMMLLTTNLIAFLSLILAKVPHSLINIPNRNYWLSPLHMNETQNILWVYCLVFAASLLGFFCVMHWLVVQAHFQNPPQINTKYLLLTTVIFLAITFYWVYSLNLNFRVLPKSDYSEMN